MRLITKITGIAAVLTLSTLTANAQATASAKAEATIIDPIRIDLKRDMNFGNVAVTTAGTVVLSPAGDRTPSGGVTLPANTGTVQSAIFNIIGAPDYTYAITLPAHHTVENGSGATMEIDQFTSDPDGTGILAGGSQALFVGATLNVGAGQAPGVYSSAGGVGFDVTVNYN